MDSFIDLQNIIRDIEKTSNFKLIIGKSVKNKPIFAFHFGKFDAPQILLTASTHAREYVSTAVGYEMIKVCSFKDKGVWFIPLVNPDGVEIVLSEKQKQYKANANLVDINVNFDANWGKGKSNLFQPHYENYIGPRPESEIETRTLTNFTRRLRPRFALNLHTKGEVIYFGDFLKNENKGKDKILASQISNITGFPKIKTSGSFGGFSDWCEMSQNIPAVTVELGRDNLPHPIPLSQTNSIMSKLKNLLDKITI